MIILTRSLNRFWNRDKSILLGGFFFLVFLIIYIWWPLAEEYLGYIDWYGSWWLYMDWLLIGIFTFMTITLVAGADLRNDLLIVVVALCGGLVIEAWGTQTRLWSYYTAERPPLWIIPAWPISTLSIDRITRLIHRLIGWLETRENTSITWTTSRSFHQFLYWVTFLTFLSIMLNFVTPTINQPFTLFSLVICIGLIATPTNHNWAVLVFMAGTGLGYFLELWGTTRECWTYYNGQTPPLFAVLAHGMAGVAFWRLTVYIRLLLIWLSSLRHTQISRSSN